MEARHNHHQSRFSDDIHYLFTLSHPSDWPELVFVHFFFSFLFASFAAIFSFWFWALTLQALNRSFLSNGSTLACDLSIIRPISKLAIPWPPSLWAYFGSNGSIGALDFRFGAGLCISSCWTGTLGTACILSRLLVGALIGDGNFEPGPSFSKATPIYRRLGWSDGFW